MRIFVKRVRMGAPFAKDARDRRMWDNGGLKFVCRARFTHRADLHKYSSTFYDSANRNVASLLTRDNVYFRRA